MKTWLHMVAFTLLVIGGINWGLIGLFRLNLVNALFGTAPGLEQLVYIFVGVSAVFIFVTHMTDCKTCMMMMKKKK